MSRDQRRNMAEPDGRIRAPAEINLSLWKDALIERSSNSTRENIRVIQSISFRIPVQHIEESIEVVCVLVHVNHHDGPLVANAPAKAPDSRTHRRQGVLSLR